MLTTDEYNLSLDNYTTFKDSSPYSCYSNNSSPSSTDSTDFQSSDEDFLQQLSADLDIPLLLNPDEDDLGLLNSFFDQSPDEIMANIALPSPLPREMDNWNMEIKVECDIKAEGPDSPTQSVGSDDCKMDPLSPVMLEGINSDHSKVVRKSPPVIQPKTAPYTVPQLKNKVMLIKTEPQVVHGPSANNVIINNMAPLMPFISNNHNKVVVLENLRSVPVATNIPPVLSPPPVCLNGTNMDPRVFKKQQRKIKNRESACLSRKKKKDYLTLLENQVKDLTDENQVLKHQNKELRERLSKYEGYRTTPNLKNGVVLCMFLLSMGFNLDYIRSPFGNQKSVAFVQNKPEISDHHGRTLLWSQGDDLEEKSNSSNTLLPLSMCPVAINQTESARLVLELERWIGRPKAGPQHNDYDTHLKITGQDTTAKKLPLKRKRKLLKKNQPSAFVSSSSPPQQRQQQYSVGSKSILGQNSNNELQVFSPTSEQIYSDFFEAINRQDDTYYVVSFSNHHMLLPALQHNKTSRPKMSLIMPGIVTSGDESQSFVPLMQIDCEVLDTRLIQIRHGAIPQHLRNTTKFPSATDSPSSEYHRHGNNNVNNTNTERPDGYSNYTHKKAYEPYFMKNISQQEKSANSAPNLDLFNIR